MNRGKSKNEFVMETIRRYEDAELREMLAKLSSGISIERRTPTDKTLIRPTLGNLFRVLEASVSEDITVASLWHELGECEHER